MEAREVDRLLDRHPVDGDVDHDLHDRAAQAQRARAADDEARLALRNTIEGAIMLVIRAPARALPVEAARSNSPSMLFRWMPVPGTTTPEPEPVEAVQDAALPSASTTEICVVAAEALDRVRELLVAVQPAASARLGADRARSARRGRGFARA